MISNAPLDSGVEERELTRFEQADEFLALLHGDDFYYPAGRLEPAGEERPIQSWERPPTAQDHDAPSKERRQLARAEEALRRLTSIIDDYQEQNYLLDPYLERIVVPPVHALQERLYQAHKAATSANTVAEAYQALALAPEVQRLAALLYRYTKVRGYKSIVHFFPHSVDDLHPTLSLLEACVNGPIEASWELRYVLLLWLGLICMIPFDFQRFDEGDPSLHSKPQKALDRIVCVAKFYLKAPGKERDSAAVLLGKVFQRRDACGEPLSAFLSDAVNILSSENAPSIFHATGLLQTLCAILKTGRANAISQHMEILRSVLGILTVSDDSDGQSDTAKLPDRIKNNSIINKYKAKMACRLGLKMLKPRRVGLAQTEQEMMDADSAQIDLHDVPEDIDDFVGMLIELLKDKDTMVRYSAAKGLARICSRLPRDFVAQMVDEILSLFAANVGDFLGASEDLSNVSEFAWQGYCLAFAELARRSLLPNESISDQLNWIQRALLFDVRRGTHSVGTGVRDAACYFVWSLARAHEADTMKPYALDLAQKLVCVSLFDRDISIRRAGSAAFQECVGRLGVFPHGIDVIRKTDFYAVGNRRNAFLVCAPDVALHLEYRAAIIEHLLKHCVPHWDVAMREVGAKSLAQVLQRDFPVSAPSLIDRLGKMCLGRDPFLVHGALLSLAEIGAACNRDLDRNVRTLCTKAFSVLKTVKLPPLRAPNTGHIAVAACLLITTCINVDVCKTADFESSDATWLAFVRLAMERQDDDAHDAAANAIGAVSRMMDISNHVRSFIDDWARSSQAQRQALVKVIGAVDYAAWPALFESSMDTLHAIAMQRPPRYQTCSVEVRRNAFKAIGTATCSMGKRRDARISDGTMQASFNTLLSGIDDYTTDARGDVGSWVRLACVQSMREILEMTGLHSMMTEAKPPLKQAEFDRLMASIAKQIAERIDSLRLEAAHSFAHLVHMFAEGTKVGQATGICTPPASLEIFPRSQREMFDNLDNLSGQFVCLLQIPAYREQVLRGLVTGIGPQREAKNRPLSDALCDFLRRGLDTDERLMCLLRDLYRLLNENLKSNRYFAPCVQTLNLVLEDDVLAERLQDELVQSKSTETSHLEKVLEAACRSVDKIKSIPRISASMSFTMNLLAFPSLQSKALTRARVFLTHPFPIIRASAAETLYLKAQEYLDTYTDDVEDVLLSTPWIQDDADALHSAAEMVIETLQGR